MFLMELPVEAIPTGLSVWNFEHTQKGNIEKIDEKDDNSVTIAWEDGSYSVVYHHEAELQIVVDDLLP